MIYTCCRIKPAKMLRVLSFLVLIVLAMKMECSDSANALQDVQNITQAPVIKPFVKSTSPNMTIKKSKQDEVDILPPHYYRDVAPLAKDRKPVKVTVSLVILNIKLSQGSSQVLSETFYIYLICVSNRHFTDF